MAFLRHSLAALAGLIFIGLAPAGLAEPGLSSSEMQSAVRVESVTIPSPGEFFAAIGKSGQPNWTQLFLPIPPATLASREQMALLLGVLVADGYIAVEAQDSQGVKNTGKDIINLAKKLNVSQSILSRSKSLNDFAENNDWPALREELEATQNEVKISMAEQQDEKLIPLVTIGAWLRGTAVVSEFVQKNYTPESAELLRQPAIVEYLITLLDALPEGTRADARVAEIRGGLETSLKTLNTNPKVALAPEDVQSLASTMNGLVNVIIKGNEGG